MVWLIIGGVLLLAFGPILWILPSKRDRRLARLRQQARLEGLNVDVRLVNRLDADPTDRVTAGGQIRQPTFQATTYALSFPRKLRYLPAWRLLRSNTTDGPVSGWQYDTTSPDRADPNVLETLADPMQALPQDVVAIEQDARSLICYWLEKAPADARDATDLKAKMDAMAAVLKAAELAKEQQDNFSPDS